MYSPFEPTKFVLTSKTFETLSILDINLHHFLLNSNIFLIFFFIYFLVISLYFYILKLKTISVELFFFMYEFVYDLVESYLGESDHNNHISDKVFPFLCYLFMFLLLNNLIGLLPFQLAITSHLSTTFACSLFV